MIAHFKLRTRLVTLNLILGMYFALFPMTDENNFACFSSSNLWSGLRSLAAKLILNYSQRISERFKLIILNRDLRPGYTFSMPDKP